MLASKLNVRSRSVSSRHWGFPSEEVSFPIFSVHQTVFSMNSARHNKKKKSTKEESSDAGVNPDDLKEVKKRGALGNLYLKGLGSVGLVENTQLEKAFVESIAQHEEYRKNVDQMFHSVELILQPNTKIVAEGKLNEDAVVRGEERPFHHPLQKVSEGIQSLAAFMNPQGKDILDPVERHILDTLPAKCTEMAEIEKKSRTTTRSLMNRTRLFLTKDFDHFKENRREVDRNLLVMDDMRNQVKKAKTKQELEKVGKGYTAAVYEFNRRADLIDRVLEGTDMSVYFHQRDLSRMFGERSKFHLEMARKVQEFDNQVTEFEKAAQKK